jgi:hypothetical protein
MRNKLTRLSTSALILTFALSSGAACARNILPDAFNNPNWPDQRGSSSTTIGSTRVSPIDDDRRFGPGNYMRDYRKATDLMAKAIRAKNRGDLVRACQFANRALDVVSSSYALRDGAMESDYSAFAAEVCEAAEKI